MKERKHQKVQELTNASKRDVTDGASAPLTVPRRVAGNSAVLLGKHWKNSVIGLHVLEAASSTSVRRSLSIAENNVSTLRATVLLLLLLAEELLEVVDLLLLVVAFKPTPLDTNVLAVASSVFSTLASCDRF
mmetsp:Transcript_18769/g.34766  ORF Transcript_18769/g.34766 Transcript_18769/m.34766 type:complete len:132 (-) Transcript_18769:521-916(-)